MTTIVSHTNCVRAQKQMFDFNSQPQQQIIQVSRNKTGLSEIKTNLACGTAKGNNCKIATGNRTDTGTMVGVVTKNKQTIPYLFSLASSRAESQRRAPGRDNETSKAERHLTEDREEKQSVGAGSTSLYKTALNMGESQEGEDDGSPHNMTTSHMKRLKRM